MKKFISKLFGLYTGRDMVSFAEYMMKEDKEPRGACQGFVSHAKFCNWKLSANVG